MAKKLFKKSSIMDTAINVGTGGAANALVDLAVESIAPTTDPMYVNVGKFVGGVVLGSMAGNNKMLRAATDGIATVGVANLVKDLISDMGTPTSGFKNEVIGKVRPGHRRLARRVTAKVGNANPVIG